MAHTENDRTTWNMRDLLEASAIPFATAEYARRRAIFHQGDTSDDVLHIEDGGVLLAVSTRSGKEAIRLISRSQETFFSPLCA